MKTQRLKILSVLFTFILSQTSFGQAPNWLWAKSIGGTESEYSYAIVADASGNVYTTGSFSGTVDFDPGPNTFNLTPADSSNTFISKLDHSGNFIWARVMCIKGSGSGRSITVDASGSVYISGYIMPSLTHGFISKLDSSGNCVWTKLFDGVYNNYSYSIKVDANKNVYTTGYFGGTVDFDPDSFGTFNLTSIGSSNTFISKLDSSGNFVWAKNIGGTGGNEASTINVDDFGNVYITGGFWGTCDFDPDTGIVNLTSAGGDIFILKLNSTGNFVWAKRMGGATSFVAGVRSSADDFGNIFTAGFFSGTVDFDPGSGLFNLSSMGESAFISKLDNSGNFLWVKAFSGTSNTRSYSLATDASGNVYTAGSSKGTTDFDPGTATYNLTAVGNSDIFIAKLNSSGNFVWAKLMGAQNEEYGYSISLDSSGNVLVTGIFCSPTINFDTNIITNGSFQNYSNIFIAKLETTTTTGFEVFENHSDFLVYPNPATNSVTIKIPSDEAGEIQIINLFGQVARAQSFVPPQPDATLQIDVTGFSVGMYMVRWISGENYETKTFSVIK